MKAVDFVDTPIALNRRRFSFGLPLLAVGVAYVGELPAAKAASGDKAPIVTHYRTRTVDGIKIFYREAGAASAPAILLLHGFPTSSHMFRNLIPELAEGFWDPIKAYWSDHSEEHRKALYVLVAPETTKFQYTDGVSDVSRIDPDNWVHDQALLDRPGNAEIQMDIFYDYRTNLPLYPAVQAYFRKHQPPTLIVWGKNDKIFPADGAHPYKRDLPKVEFHLIDTGHFALEDKADEMVPLIRDFLNRKISS